jgi:hypothetical protein
VRCSWRQPGPGSSRTLLRRRHRWPLLMTFEPTWSPLTPVAPPTLASISSYDRSRPTPIIRMMPARPHQLHMAQPGSPSHPTGPRWLPATAFDPLSVARGIFRLRRRSQRPSRPLCVRGHFAPAAISNRPSTTKANAVLDETGNSLGAALSRGPDSHIWIKALPMTGAVLLASAHALLARTPSSSSPRSAMPRILSHLRPPLWPPPYQSGQQVRLMSANRHPPTPAA